MTSVPQNEQLANTPESPFAKRKRAILPRSPDREMGKSQGEREPHLGEREGDRSRSMGRKE